MAQEPEFQPSDEEVYTGEQEDEDGASIRTVRWVKELLLRAPWFAASAIFISFLILAATVITFASKPSNTDGVIEMRVAANEKIQPMNLEKRSTVERKGLPFKDIDDGAGPGRATSRRPRSPTTMSRRTTRTSGRSRTTRSGKSDEMSCAKAPASVAPGV